MVANRTRRIARIHHQELGFTDGILLTATQQYKKWQENFVIYYKLQIKDKINKILKNVRDTQAHEC